MCVYVCMILKKVFITGVYLYKTILSLFTEGSIFTSNQASKLVNNFLKTTRGYKTTNISQVHAGRLNGELATKENSHFLLTIFFVL